MLCFFAAGVAVLAVPKTGTVALETMLGRMPISTCICVSPGMTST